MSKRGQRAGCPLTNPRGFQGERSSPQRRFHKGDVRCVPRFLDGSASGGKGLCCFWPLDPGCRRTFGLSEQSRAGKNGLRDTATRLTPRPATIRRTTRSAPLHHYALPRLGRDLGDAGGDLSRPCWASFAMVFMLRAVARFGPQEWHGLNAPFHAP